MTVYPMFHSGCAYRAVSRSTRSFWPRFAGCQRASRAGARIATHSDLLSGRPMVEARSIRVVAAAAFGMARSAAKSEISARNGATVASFSPASCARVLDHGQSSARLTKPLVKLSPVIPGGCREARGAPNSGRYTALGVIVERHPPISASYPPTYSAQIDRPDWDPGA